MAGTTSEFRDEGSERGRSAERPTEIGIRGYRDVFARVKRNIKRDDVSLLAAGVAFYALLALVPALVALVSVKLRGTALLLTIALLILGPAALVALVVWPQSLSSSGGEGMLRAVVMVVRWLLATGVAITGLAVLYRFAADRDWPRWNWASPGAIVATIIWLAASIGFAIYTANFGKYNETYGALGAIVVVMLWLYIGAYAVIAGAELNGELEHQTAHDTTRGRPEPMGTRDAYVADTIGETAPEVKASRPKRRGLLARLRNRTRRA